MPQIFFGAPDSSVLSIVVFWTVFYLWFFAEMFFGYRLTRRRQSSTAVAKDAGSKWFLIASIWAGIGLGFLAALALPSLAFREHRHALFAAGIVLALAGMALRWYSIWYLGQSFTCEVATRPDQTVRDTGPYHLVRHPSYAGGLLTVLGLLLCLTNPLAFLGFLVTAAGYAYRIKVEERVLADQLGEPYRRYMGRTKRLIPFVL